MECGTPALVAFVLGMLALAALISCSPAEPTPPPVPTSSNTCTVTGSGTCNIGNGNGNVTNPTPNPAASPGGDNVVEGFAIFCYGFGAVPPQPEPNHNECALPVGYPNIAVTASPKNKAGVDVPNPGDKTSPDIIDWRFSVSPAGAATLNIQADNRFNAKVEPASPRVAANFTLVAIYKDPQGNIRTADKAGSIK
jgi:hypothetical protein